MFPFPVSVVRTEVSPLIIRMRKTYKYKLYTTDRTKHLDEMIEIARQIWNHSLALQKRYYRIYGKYVTANRMKTHLTKLKRMPKYRHWKKLGSQAAQDVVERLDRSYHAFFEWCKTRSGSRKSPPKFRKKWKYRSFTLKQAGWSITGNEITIGGFHYKFWLHRTYHGTVKTVTVKRSSYGEYFIFLSVEEEILAPDAHTGNAVGIDFGLKTFLTLSDRTSVESPQWLLHELNLVRRTNRNLSRKQKGSGNRRRARLAYAKVHEDIANRRTDWFFKLAKELATRYSVICIEDLNLKGMQRMWGRKISDLAFFEFVKILECEASIHGCEIVRIDRWYPSSKTCHCCGHVFGDLTLKDRKWTCPSCRTEHDRDVNAAINILNQGLLARFGASA